MARKAGPSLSDLLGARAARTPPRRGVYAHGKPGNRITEDDPRFIPGLMGDRKWGKKWRGPENYSKGRGRPD